MSIRLTFISICITLLLTVACSTAQEDAAIQQQEADISKTATILNNPTKFISPASTADFMHDVGSRFIRTITKEELLKATSAEIFLDQDMIDHADSYMSSELTVLNDQFDDSDWSVTAEGSKLSKEQIDLLQSLEEANNFVARVRYMERFEGNDQLYDRMFTPYFSVVPHQQAEYIDGKATLIQYLRDNSAAKTADVQSDKLKAGKIMYTVSDNGTISDVRLIDTCGYPEIDEQLIELMQSVPGKWSPARDESGNPVDQTFVYSFGMTGC